MAGDAEAACTVMHTPLFFFSSSLTVLQLPPFQVSIAFCLVALAVLHMRRFRAAMALPVGAALAGLAYKRIPEGPDPEFPDRRASVACKCGGARLEFRNHKALCRLQCACFDCRQRVQWSEARGCPIGKYAAPVDAVYLANAITSVCGE